MGEWEADVVLADGGTAHLRPVRPEDEPSVSLLYASLSESSRYLRFFSSVSAQVAGTIGPNVHNDDRHFALVVESDDDVIGVADYFRQPGDVAEVAFAVRDDQQGRGLGTLLLDHLAEVAAAHGIRHFVAQVLARNDAMRSVFRDAGFGVRFSRAETGTVEVVLELDRTERWRAAHAGREQSAEARSVQRLVTPRSVAVVGASRRRDAIGNAVLRNLRDSGYTGALYPVNPHAAAIEGLPAVASVSEIDGPLDLVVVAVPAAAVAPVLEAAAAKHVQSVVVISGGFAETGGGDGQVFLRSFARAHGMRVVGPNCVGVVNTAPDIVMNATFAPAEPRRGPLALGSDSGAIGIELMARVGALGLGLSTFVSLGNKADVSANDLLQYWETDDATRVIALYLESFGNPRKFARLARRIARTKPIVALKSGRTPAGTRGAASHTAALAAPDLTVDQLFRQAGVVRVDTLEELFEAASLFVHQPLPGGRRVAIVTNGGGPGILAADACALAGLEVPELSDEVQAELRAVTPPGAGVRNPVDLVASARPDVYTTALRAVLGSGEVDAAIVLYVSPIVTRPVDVEGAVLDAVREYPEVPVAACFLGADVPQGTLHRDGTPGAVPMFSFPESAARALGRAAELAEWRRNPAPEPPEVDGIDDVAANAVVDGWLRDHPDGGWVDALVAARLLETVGVGVVASRTAATAANAVVAAEELGYPVVLKAASPDLVHKTEQGGVRLGLGSADAVRTAFTEMHDRLGPHMGGAVLQATAAAGIELIAGITQDPLFGPVVLFGMGGTAAELLRDTTIRLVPLTGIDAHDMVCGLRTSPLLFGYRGSAAVDVRAIEDLLLRLGRLADRREVAELDCNPVVATAQGVVVLDVKLRLQPVPPANRFTVDD